MCKRLIIVLFIVFGTGFISACTSNASGTAKTTNTEFVSKTANPMLWRATLATLQALPVEKADPNSGIITYDWGSFEGVVNERIKATVYILDTRLRADAVKVALFREIRDDKGAWIAADTDPATAEQLESKILELARLYSLNTL